MLPVIVFFSIALIGLAILISANSRPKKKAKKTEAKTAEKSSAPEPTKGTVKEVQAEQAPAPESKIS